MVIIMVNPLNREQKMQRFKELVMNYADKQGEFEKNFCIDCRIYSSIIHISRGKRGVKDGD